MKKTISILVAVLVLASCSSKFTLVKRKYNKGFYLSVNKNKNSNEQNTTKAIAKNSAVNKTKEAEEKMEQVVVLAQNENLNKPSSDNSPVIAKENKPVKNTHITANKLDSKSQATTISKAFYNTANKMEIGKRDSKSGGGSVSPIVSIILCIFIPPLAVYLFKGSIDNNFWLDLILSLLFYLPGIIFAFLVCFGGVSI